MSGLTRRHKLGYDGKLFLNNPALGGGITGGAPDEKQSTITPTVSTPTVSTPTPTFEYDKQVNLDDALKTAMGDWKGYNINADPFYQQMVDRYTKNAQLGMEDAMGRAAALTGGYGSSFAQAVGQQAYYNQMDGLNDLALDIYNNAYQRWRDKKNDAWNNYEYYATDKAAKEKQWMIDNGLAPVDDGNGNAVMNALTEFNKISALLNQTYNEVGGGDEGLNAVAKVIQSFDYDEETEDYLMAMFFKYKEAV